MTSRWPPTALRGTPVLSDATLNELIVKLDKGPESPLTMRDYSHLLSLAIEAKAANRHEPAQAITPELEVAATSLGKMLSFPTRDDFMVVPMFQSSYTMKVRRDTVVDYYAWSSKGQQVVRFTLEGSNHCGLDAATTLDEFEQLLFPYEPPKDQ
jgi:hypothetical protein